MKKTLLVLLVLFTLSMPVLAACTVKDVNGTSSVSSENTSSEGETSSEETVSSAVPEVQGDIEIVYASYSERPYACVVGKCAEGALVRAESENDVSEALSWHGWFSLRINCPKRGTTYTFTQTVDGSQVGSPTVKAVSPTLPSAEMWPVVTGKDSQLFFQKMLPDFEQTNLPTQSVLNAFQNRIQTRLSTIHNYNPDAEIIYMVVPSSMTVYPELVPEKYTPGTGKSRLDLTMEAARNAGATVIDLKSIFAEHKDDELPLYYKFDSHWTDYGAFVAYDALFEHIAKSFPAAAPRDFSEFSWNAAAYESGDMIYYLGMSREVVKEYGYYRTMNFSDASCASSVPRYISSRRLTYHDLMTNSRTFRSGDGQKPNLMVIRDSYSTQIYDILAERGNTTHYLGMWDYTWDNSLISSERPDYIIYIASEWNLDSILSK